MKQHPTERTNTAVTDQEITSNITGEEPRILMAEDNLINQKLASMLFSKLGQDLKIVSNGEEALEEVRNNSYDIVFMDVQMPVMDGITATAMIKNELAEKAPFIVALTANAMPGDEERFLEAGMDHYLTKPIEMAKLNEVIDRMVTS